MDGIIPSPFFVYLFLIINIGLHFPDYPSASESLPFVKLQKSYVSQKMSPEPHCGKRQMGEISVWDELKGIKGCNGYILKSIRCKRTSLGIVSFSITFL